jgi:hypothetical protein
LSAVAQRAKAEAIHLSTHAGPWIASSQSLLAMTGKGFDSIFHHNRTRARILATPCVRGCVNSALANRRGRREDRVHAAPAVSRAICTKQNAHEHTGSAEASGLPCAVVYGLLRALPGERALLPPSSPRSLLLRNLTPASRRQNHATSPSASACVRHFAGIASTASHRAFRDVRTPLLSGETGGEKPLICPTVQEKYF